MTMRVFWSRKRCTKDYCDRKKCKDPWHTVYNFNGVLVCSSWARRLRRLGFPKLEPGEKAEIVLRGVVTDLKGGA